MPIGKVWIYRLLFVCNFGFYTVTNFSGEDKASGVKFCTASHRRPGQGISYFGELCSIRSSKWDESASHPKVKFRVWRPTVNVTLENAPFVKYRAACGRRSACVDRGQPRWRTCLYVCLFVGLFFGLYVRLRISQPRIKLAASNFARRFIGIQCRKSPILWTLLRQKP